MPVTQTLKRVAVRVIGFLLLLPSLVAFVDWLIQQWQTYIVGLGTSACCYWLTRRRRASDLPERIGAAERLPVAPSATMGPKG